MRNPTINLKIDGKVIHLIFTFLDHYGPSTIHDGTFNSISTLNGFDVGNFSNAGKFASHVSFAYECIIVERAPEIKCPCASYSTV